MIPTNTDISSSTIQENVTQSKTIENKITHNEIQQLTDTRQLAQPYPAPILSATFKEQPSDFQVDEIMEIDLSGEGEHLWLLIKKTGMNTSYVADQLAKWAKIPNRDVGYSGLKDRQAVTTQWFSLRIPKSEMPETDLNDFLVLSTQDIGQSSHHKNDRLKPRESIEILDQVWHSKKLNRGTHKANRFLITLHNIELNQEVATDNSSIDDTLNAISNNGVPNYFGSQRYGRNGNNIDTALEWFEQGTIKGRKPHPKKSRDIQSLLLSSARSAIFNQILSTRVIDGSWNMGLDGEVFNLEGSGSVFSSEQLDAELQQRLVSGDIHPTGPLWGINNNKVTGAARSLEEKVISENPILQRLTHGLETKQIKTMRRALRLPVNNLNWSWTDNKTLVLDFSLPTGTFATSVLANLIAHLDS